MESRLVGLEEGALNELCISQQHPPDIVFSDPSVIPPTPSKQTALSRDGRVEYEYDTTILDHYNQVQGVPGVSHPSAKKRKREEKGVEAGPMKKRKKVDNSQYDATNGGSIIMDGSILNEPYQPSIDTPLPSYALAPLPPVDSPLLWTMPVPTTTSHTAQFQVLEPAPSSRFRSANGTSKKGRCAAWHVWSKVCNRTLPKLGRRAMTEFLR